MEYKGSELIHSFVKNELLEISCHDTVNLVYPKVNDMTQMCIALWSKATGTDLSHQPRYYTMIIHKNGSLTYLSPTTEIMMKPTALTWFGSQGSHEGVWYPWGFLLQILTTFVSSATIVSVLHYCEHHFTARYIVFNVFSLKELIE